MSYLFFSKREKSFLERRNSQQNLTKRSGNYQQAQSENEGQSSGVTSGFIGTLEDAPSFMRGNVFIKSGYRIRNHSPKKVLKSMFKIHNETVNIWTHLIPLTVVLFILFQVTSIQIEKNHFIGQKLVRDFVRPYILQNKIQCRNKNFSEFLRQQLTRSYQQSHFQNYSKKKVPTWPLAVSLFGASFCLACSVTYHLFRSSTKYFFQVSRSLDFAGIGIYICLSTVPAFFYEFHCQKNIGMFYNVVSLISGTIFSFYSIKSDGAEKVQLITIAINIVLAFSALFHLVIRQFVFQSKDSFTFVPTLYLYLGAAFFSILGTYILYTRCPERYHPGRYDLCGHSHQLWHICIVIMMIFMFLAALASYEMRVLWVHCHGSCKNYQ